MEKTNKGEVNVNNFPIVGIGASAGGLAAFEGFFSGFQKESLPQMAFVLVQHLAPDRPSALPELIQRFTSMVVVQATDNLKVEINCCYIIPPNVELAVVDRILKITEPVKARGHRLPIDFLFTSLALDQLNRSIVIILSGSGNDGTLGLKAVHENGGMVMVQIPAQSEFDGMPLSAVATGLVDFELPLNEMAKKLLGYVGNLSRKVRTQEDVVTDTDSSALERIFTLIKSGTGHDFSRYKPNTILRRIERRMALLQIKSFDSYALKLGNTAQEVTTLFKELLIGVTQFFRDKDAFDKFELSVVPKLFEEDVADSTLRVWVAGCSTGEEAYSVAILLQEHIEKTQKQVRLIIFATDVNSSSIAFARAGIYPKSIENNVSAVRLARFFTLEADGNSYRIRKVIRDSLIFSEHDVIKDPPFSKIDLITCRNLLIYFESDLQRKIIALFHYALNSKGLLFLGSSESVGEFVDLFTSIDRKAKIYQRNADVQAGKRAALARGLPRLISPATNSALPVNTRKIFSKPSLRELTEQSLLKLVAPVAALVNKQGDLLYLHGRSGLFLEPTVGDVTINNILKMAREGLRKELAAALYQVALTQQAVRAVPFKIGVNENVKNARLSISPVSGTNVETGATHLFLVVLEEVATDEVNSFGASIESLSSVPPEQTNHVSNAATSKKIQKLAQQLKIKEDVLQASNLELENSNEELKSTNEEMQSVNEELQSTNEELETSKEEMQSINEELTTVNTELTLKMNDSHRVNNDMNNLLAGTGVGTIFLDLQMRVLRFTPAITNIIPLIKGDVGRPLADLVTNLIGYNSLVVDVSTVLETLTIKEATVQTAVNNFYTLRILPYRTLENVVEGAVITFIDITEIVRIRVALRKANDLLRLAVVVRDSFDAITVQDLTGRTMAWNPAAQRMYGWTEQEALALNVTQRIPPFLRDQIGSVKNSIKTADVLEPVKTQRYAKDGRVVNILLTSTALLDDNGDIYAIATTEKEDKT